MTRRKKKRVRPEDLFRTVYQFKVTLLEIESPPAVPLSSTRDCSFRTQGGVER